MSDGLANERPGQYDEADLTAADEQIRLYRAKLSDVYVALLAAADVIVNRLRERLLVVNNVAVALTEIDPPWAKFYAQRLKDAIRAAEIKRPDGDAAVRHQDREAKILLSLPKKTEEAISE